MATKSLARTVIEGGRAHGNCWDRRSSNGRLRVRESVALMQLRRDPAGDDIEMPRRKHVGRWFHDKLGPARRWLASQVGRPWNIVRGEILQRFDTRSTPGRHVVFGHIFPWVEGDDRCVVPSREFVVDRRGILRRLTRPSPTLSNDWRRVLPNDGHDIERWLDGRLVGERGGALFWFVPTPSGAFRQHARLTESDGALWLALPKWFRDEHTPRI